MPIEYVDSDGRVPRGMVEIDNAQVLKTLLLIKIALDEGGSVTISGLGNPQDVAYLMSYELKVGGLGDGRILISAVRKDAGD